MSGINPWLQSLGLEKYREVFASDIDLTVAPELSEQDLEKLGLSLGHRRKFIAAAAKLRPTTSIPTDACAPAHVRDHPGAVVNAPARRAAGLD